MGGVDLLDQLISYYRISIKTRKWTLKMIAHALDLAVCNAWLEYRKTLKKRKEKNVDLL